MTDSVPVIPSNPPSDGTIDITNIVEALRSSFVTWATAYIFGLEIATPGLEWMALPVISTLDQAVVKEILTLLTKAAVMEAFFMNTAIRKASQAQDYIDAVNAKINLPSTATFEEFTNAEKAEMDAFRNFVRVTN